MNAFALSIEFGFAWL